MLLHNEKAAHPGCPADTFPALGTKPEAHSTLAQAIRHNAGRFPRQPVIVSSAFEPLTYRDLQAGLDKVRRELRQTGFGCDARIGVLMPSGPEAVLAIVAVSCCSVAVPLDPRLPLPELGRRLAILRLNGLLVPRGGASEARQIAEEKGIPIIEAAPVGQGRLGLRIIVRSPGPPVVDTEPNPSSPAFILQTSGTTAEPKLIPFSHINMLAAALRLQTWFGLTAQDRCLSVSPSYYSHGLKVTVFTPLLTGGSIAIPSNIAVLALDEWFDHLRPTWYSAGPTLHNSVWEKVKSLSGAPIAHTLRFITSGGAPLPNEIRGGLERILGVPVLEHYGSSEAAQIAVNRPGPGASKPRTCGQPWPGTVMIADAQGNSLRTGERGEIWVRGPTVMAGYLDAPEHNHASFVKGWLRTGDIGSLDSDGFLSLHGRISETINRGGEKIAPLDVDNALLRHPAISEAAAFKIPHPRLGEDIAAAVVLRTGAQVTPAEIRSFLQGELASFKIPHRIVILDQLPKGITGKVQRRRLSETFGMQTNPAPVRRDVGNTEKPLDLEAELLALWQKLLKSKTLTVDDDFFQCGGDSLLAMEMLIEVERIVGHQVPETILFGAETIRQLVPKIADAPIATTSPVFEFYAESNKSPLHFFHGDLASGHSSLRRVVELLGRDYPIASIDPHGLRGEPLPSTIEGMAADRLPLILERQVSGPFLLGGKCNGAMVAFETARLLVQAGHEVAMVVMVDPPIVGARPVSRTVLRMMRHLVSPQRLGQVHEQLAWLGWFLKIPPGERMIRLTRFLNLPMCEKSARVREALSSSNHGVPPVLWDVYASAMAQYLPERLDVPVVFYAADYDGQAWRRISPRLEMVQVSGGHRDCLTTGADPLVDHLRQRLDRLTDGTVRLQ